jgi:hypothetical protein
MMMMMMMIGSTNRQFLLEELTFNREKSLIYEAGTRRPAVPN